jgi:thermostable 8-oxoguanine DNA glycosylase
MQYISTPYAPSTDLETPNAESPADQQHVQQDVHRAQAAEGISPSQKPQQTGNLNEWFEQQKRRLKAAGHRFDESEADFLFGEARGNAATVRKIIAKIEATPNTHTRAVDKLKEERGEQFASEFDDNIGVFGTLYDR